MPLLQSCDSTVYWRAIMNARAPILRWSTVVLVLLAWARSAEAQIHVIEARIGCLDIQRDPNLTNLVATVCERKQVCSYKAPTPKEYTAAGVKAATRTFCTQAMEIAYRCGDGPAKTVMVPGDAWGRPPANLLCAASPASGGTPVDAGAVPVLNDLLQRYQRCIVEQYESPTPPNPGLGPLRDVSTCVAGNACTRASRQYAYAALRDQAARGDAADFVTNLKQAVLADCFQCQKHAERHTKQMHCTMECNGNNSYPSFDPGTLGIGPCFETCKAGVDATKLVNDLITDIEGAVPQASGGITVSTNHRLINPSPDPERCVSTPDGYFVAPPDLLDWTPTDAPPFNYLLTNFHPSASSSSPICADPFLCPGCPQQPSTCQPTRSSYTPLTASAAQQPGSLRIGANEGRLRTDLRDAAGRANPIESLCKAATAFATGDATSGTALADLSVTGRRAFTAFRARPPQESDVLACLRSDSRVKTLPASKLKAAAGAALDRAYRVLTVLRVGGWPVACPERGALGYIAVSSEDDLPHRAVNVPSSEFPQYDISFDVPRKSGGSPLRVHTRYMIAHTVPPAAAAAASCAYAGLKVPAERAPALASDAEVIVYLHGLDSRLEEALLLARELHALGHQRGKNYTVVSVDLPTSGYADHLDHLSIAPLDASGHAGGSFNLAEGLTFAPNRYDAPLLQFDEDFVVAFVDALDDALGHQLKPRIKALVGGSLGGNLAMRLGRPRADARWIVGVVPWSPGSIWPSFADDPVEHAALAVPWYFAGGDPAYAEETPGARRAFFYGGFDWASKIGLVYEPSGGGRAQAEFWWRDGWVDAAGHSCKQAHMHLARIERYETYDRALRQWHWRLGMEQLLFSQQENNSVTNEPLYLSNTIRMLVMCGMNDTGGNLCASLRAVAPQMELTPGYALFLTNTGHSIHDERPRFLASRIADFIDRR
jgi:hypothetical protein